MGHADGQLGFYYRLHMADGSTLRTVETRVSADSLSTLEDYAESGRKAAARPTPRHPDHTQVKTSGGSVYVLPSEILDVTAHWSDT